MFKIKTSCLQTIVPSERKRLKFFSISKLKAKDVECHFADLNRREASCRNFKTLRDISLNCADHVRLQMSCYQSNHQQTLGFCQRQEDEAWPSDADDKTLLGLKRRVISHGVLNFKHRACSNASFPKDVGSFLSSTNIWRKLKIKKKNSITLIFFEFWTKNLSNFKATF